MLLTLCTASLLLLPACAPQSNDSTPVGDPNAPALIEPGKSVGDVKQGMTVDDVIRTLGEPQRKTSNALEYTKKGFAVMPDAEGVVRVVMCGDVTGFHGPLVPRFKARTGEGIGLGSTREEVLKAYGQPTTEEAHAGGRISLDYRNLGMTFSVEAGKVHHIIVRLGEEYQPGSSVGVDNRKQ